MKDTLSRSGALWNRDRLDLASDEILAQILDRGDLGDWRALYALTAGSSPEAAELRRRIVRICSMVPVAFPNLFLAAMAWRGEALEPWPELGSSSIETT